MEPIMNRVGEVYEPFKVHFLTKRIEKLQEDEVLIKVRASAICGSDLHIARGMHPSAPLPVTIGHEFSGDVVAIGKNVHNIGLGERVTVEPCIVCGECEACRHGDYGYCEHITFTYRNGDGAMADYVVVKSPYVYSLPDYLSYETGALIEPLAVATHAVRRADVRLGEQVLIIGAGAIGMMTAAMCRRSGAAEVIVADFSESRLEMALKVGATRVINSKKTDLEVEVMRLTEHRGVDKSFECVGRESCFNQAIMTLKRCASRSPWCCRRMCCSLARSRRTCAGARRTPPWMKSGKWHRAPRQTALSHPLPTAMIRTWDRAVLMYRVARSRDSVLPGLCLSGQKS